MLRCSLICRDIKNGLLKVSAQVIRLIYSFFKIYIVALHERNLKKKNYQLNIGGTDERDLQDAIEKSKADYESSQQKEEFVFGKALF